ncbi:hypothetical protein IMSHALPRED_008220 [Imshaugia aleurites]|uniref:Uncharacterized protein n=1 Tax=Imshaugia aleurites TaxID=172621 RepID=A0A8H3FQX5_9LECA|nr:hypothetical protein IMSHALPRED_008220 [Imshaugia aleurites]
MFYRFHSKSPWLKRVLIPFWAFQIILMLSLISVFVVLRGSPINQNSNVIIVVIISAVCIVLSVTEIILFAATRLHPLTYLILQLTKTKTWFVLFVLSWPFSLVGDFVWTLVLFITFLSALIYASVVYHRHRRAQARFLRSIHGSDLFPVIADETAASPVHSHRSPHAPRKSIKEISPAEVAYPAESKEALEVTVLRELGGDWDVYELPATRSVRSLGGAR